MTDLSQQQKTRLHAHEEEDEEEEGEGEEVVYQAKNGASAGTSTSTDPHAGNGSLLTADAGAANLYTFSPADLKSDMDKMKSLLHLKP